MCVCVCVCVFLYDSYMLVQGSVFGWYPSSIATSRPGSKSRMEIHVSDMSFGQALRVVSHGGRGGMAEELKGQSTPVQFLSPV